MQINKKTFLLSLSAASLVSVTRAGPERSHA
jgi:hypothetical protein